MDIDVGQIFPTASLHRDHSILYALVCEKELSHMGKNNRNPDQLCVKVSTIYLNKTAGLLLPLQIAAHRTYYHHQQNKPLHLFCY